MPEYLTPDVYVEEVAAGPRPIQAVGTRTAGFVGVGAEGRRARGEAVGDQQLDASSSAITPGRSSASTPLSNAVFGFFQNGGSRCFVVNTATQRRCRRRAHRRRLRRSRPRTRSPSWPRPGCTDAASYDALLDALRGR